MKKIGRTVRKKGQKGIMRARLLAVALLLALVCLCGVLYAAGFLSVRMTVVKEAYDTRATSLGVVKIVCGDFRGSGVVIARDEEGLVIASAKHLLMYDVRAKVSFVGMESGENVAGDVIGYSASYDLAFLHVPLSALPAKLADNARNAYVTENGSDMAWSATPDANGQQVVMRTDDAYRELRAGDFIVQIGLSENAELVYYVGAAQAKEVLISDYNAFMLLNECYAEAGMSGGGAFDENGCLVGIIIAGDAEGTICMPMTTVLEEYREFTEPID